MTPLLQALENKLHEITWVNANDRETAVLLKKLGLTPGEFISVISSFKDHVIIRKTDDTRVLLGSEAARCVLVRQLS